MRSRDNIWPPDIKKSHKLIITMNLETVILSNPLGFYGNNYLPLYHLCSSFEIISRAPVKLVSQRDPNVPVQHTGRLVGQYEPSKSEYAKYK